MGKAIRASANGQPCSLRLKGCDLNQTTVLAHIRLGHHMAGAKPNDSMALYACHNCHDIIDRRKNSDIMEKEILHRIICGMAETHDELIEQGLLVLK